jgi:SHS2 domain-containing protein
MNNRGHETIDHAADMGIRGWGRTPAEAFEEAAAAMIGIMIDGTGLVPSKRIDIAREGADLVELLLEFLNAILVEGDLAETAVLSAAVESLSRVNGVWKVAAIARGLPLSEVRDRLLVEVKAATFYGASVEEHEQGSWMARCVVDL